MNYHFNNMNHVDNPFESPVILSTCTGMRGLEIGVEGVLGELRVAAYVEIESFVAENLVQQMEQGVLAAAPVWTNLKTFPWEAFYGKLHWIIGGYPCQPFSHAGLRQGATDPRHLWPSYRRGIKKSRPMGVYFENVEGHISLGLRDVLTDLRKLGYQVEVGLFSAAEVGAPHRRNRIFILGLENSFLIRMRGWSDEQRAYWRRKIQTSGSGELGDATIRENNGRGAGIVGCQKQEGGCEHAATCSSGETMDNASSNGLGSEHEISARGNGAELAGETEGLVDAKGSGERGGSGDVHQADGRSLGELSFESGSTGDFGDSFEECERKAGLADADTLGESQFERLFREVRERVVNGSKTVGNAAIEHAGPRTRENGEIEPGRSGLADSIGQGLEEREEQHARQECQTAERSGDESGGRLADTNIRGEQQWVNRGVGRIGEQIQEEGSSELRLRSQLDNNGESVSDGEVSELQGDRVGYGDFSGWPARPGEPQYDWEAPRLESSVGYAVNGYNYREDLLRMAGNAVVPQQSEKAFRTLLLKFLK